MQNVSLFQVHSAPKLTRSCNDPASLQTIRGVIECENPNADLTKFVGRLKVLQRPDEGEGDPRCANRL